MKKLLSILAAFCGLTAVSACASSTSDDSLTVLSPAAFVQQLQADTTAYLLDVRRPDEYAEGHLPGAHLLDYLNTAAFQAGVKQLDKSKTIYVYCRSGRRSNAAAGELVRLGFTVKDMKGGYLEWQKMQNR